MTPTSHLTTKLLKTILLFAAAGLAFGCEPNNRSAFKSPAPNAADGTTTKSVASNAKSGARARNSDWTSEQTQRTHAQSGSDAPVVLPPADPNAPTNQPGVVVHRPGQKLEPFWISMIAEADRAIWDDQFKGDKGLDVLASRTAPTMPMFRPTGDDGSEGLSHITMASEGADFDPSISRDGRFIVFASTQHRPTSDIYLKSTTGRTITQLTSDPGNDVMPAFSPDGQRIAFCSNRNGNWDIFVMPVTGGQALQITSDPSHELHPTWSPDGKKLAFCRLGETSGRWEMWAMEVGGTSSSEFLGYGMFPQWCPVAHTGMDGRDRILFQRSRERGDHAFSIWTIDYRAGDASSPTEIASAQGQALINASWAPDGTRIVYATIANPNELATASDKMPQSTLWMTSIDGSQRVVLTSGPFMNLMPTWSTDGRIYFVSDRTGVPNIWSIGTEKAITAATGHAPTKVPATEFTSVPEDHAAPVSHN